MKKALLFLFIPISFHLFAQTKVYHPFPDSNAAWNVGSGYLSGNTPVQCEEWNWLQGDTIVGGAAYHKIYRYYTCWYLSPPYLFYNGYYGAIRQDTAARTVYYLPNTATVEQLLYDFNLSVGDTLGSMFVNPGNSNRVVYADSVLIGTKYNNRFWLSPLGQSSPWDSAYAAIIEGVGSTLGLLFPIYPPFESGSSLNCFWQNGKPVYPDSTYACDFATGIFESNIQIVDISISPNPSTGNFTITSFAKFQYSVYDIFGREVLQSISSDQSSTLDLTSYPKGIYFVRGKAADKMFSRKIILQ